MQQEGAVPANELAQAAEEPGQVQTRHTHSVPRSILPNSIVQKSQLQPVNPLTSPGYETPQLPNSSSDAERFAPPQYRLDAGQRLYPAVPSPYSQIPISEKPEMMAATQTAMGHHLSAYNPHTLHSPTSVTSPSHSHSRQLYSSIPQQQQQYYYGTYIPSPQAHYGYNTTFQHPSLPATQQQYGLSPYQPTHQLTQPQSSPQQQYPGSNESMPTPKVPIQRSPQVPSSATASGGRTSQHGQSSSSGSAQSAAPGPIRATTPTVVKQDHNGVTTISFEYSKDRVKRPYEIRCDVESVPLKTLSKEHKEENCVYPRACSGEAYRGNRWQYENECNEVAWALAWLNPELRGKRGLIQRAVDSWRNSNRDKKLRSRRVRRLAKTERREKLSRLQQEQQQYQNDTKKAQAAAFLKGGGPIMPGSVAVSNGITQPDSTISAGMPQYHHHMVQTSDSPQIGGLTGTSYGDTKPPTSTYQQ